jgi:hypothetical protein
LTDAQTAVLGKLSLTNGKLASSVGLTAQSFTGGITVPALEGIKLNGVEITDWTGLNNLLTFAQGVDMVDVNGAITTAHATIPTIYPALSRMSGGAWAGETVAFDGGIEPKGITVPSGNYIKLNSVIFNRCLKKTLSTQFSPSWIGKGNPLSSGERYASLMQI